MKGKNTPIFYFLRNKKGGILFPVLAILFMFTFLLLFITQDYFSRREMLVNTKDFYLAKTLEELSSSMMDEESLASQSISYNIGTSNWNLNKTKDQFNIETSLSNQYKRTSKRQVSKKR